MGRIGFREEMGLIVRDIEERVGYAEGGDKFG